MHIRQDVAVPAHAKNNVADQTGPLPQLPTSNWAPLEKLCPPGLCEQFMFMGVAGGIYLYKHVDSRRYLNVDVLGATYAYNPATSGYDPISVAAAMRALEEDEFLGTRRGDLEKLFTRFERAAGHAPKAVRP
jgi:hypothetical protein